MKLRIGLPSADQWMMVLSALAVRNERSPSFLPHSLPSTTRPHQTASLWPSSTSRHSHVSIDQTRAVQSHEVEISSGSCSTAPWGGKRGAEAAADDTGEPKAEGEWLEPDDDGRKPGGRLPVRGPRVGEDVSGPPPPEDLDAIGVVSPVLGLNVGRVGIDSESGRVPARRDTGDDVPEVGTLNDGGSGARGTGGARAMDRGVTAQVGVDVESEQTLCAWPAGAQRRGEQPQFRQPFNPSRAHRRAECSSRDAGRREGGQYAPTSVRIGCSLGLAASSRPGVAPASPSTLDAQLPLLGASCTRMRPDKPPDAMRPGRSGRAGDRWRERQPLGRGLGGGPVGQAARTVCVVAVRVDEGDAVDVRPVAESDATQPELPQASQPNVRLCRPRERKVGGGQGRVGGSRTTTHLALGR